MSDAAALLHASLRPARDELLFRADADRAVFRSELCAAFAERGGRCLGWALLPGRVELLLRGDASVLSQRLASLAARYARAFNHRHRRRGYLFADNSLPRPVPPALLPEVLWELLLAPWREGEVATLDALEAHPWSGLGALTGRRPPLAFEAARAARAVLGLGATAVSLALARRARALDRGGANVVRSGFTPRNGLPGTREDSR